MDDIKFDLNFFNNFYNHNFSNKEDSFKYYVNHVDNQKFKTKF